MTPMDRPYTQADMDVVSDCPELTDVQLANARPFADVFPDQARAMRAADVERLCQVTPGQGASRSLNGVEQVRSAWRR